jgi:hypothetical protein
MPRYGGAYLTGAHAEYHRLLYQRVSNGELIYKQVEVVFHQQGLRLIIFRLLLHEGYRFLIRHYEPPPTAIPIMHVMSFDDEVFYLGSFYPDEAPNVAHRLYIHEPNVTQILKNYWNVLWNGAIPLNEGGIINWPELKRIGLRLGMADNEFESMISDLKAQVEREKRKLKRR